jgi:hypothetical protein
MRYLLLSPEPNVIELLDEDGETVYRKDIRDLAYPAPAVKFVGPFTIVETCPDSGRHIDEYFK